MRSAFFSLGAWLDCRQRQTTASRPRAKWTSRPVGRWTEVCHGSWKRQLDTPDSPGARFRRCGEASKHARTWASCNETGRAVEVPSARRREGRLSGAAVTDLVNGRKARCILPPTVDGCTWAWMDRRQGGAGGEEVFPVSIACPSPRFPTNSHAVPGAGPQPLICM